VADVRHVVQAGEVDRLIARLAASQHGVVSRAQLVAAGVRRAAIHHRLAGGRLHPLHRGVYLVGHPVPPPLAREIAALLACGAAAVLSHLSAAYLWKLLPQCPAAVHVTLASGRGRSRPGLTIHSTSSLAQDERRTLRGLPLTAPARTLIDLAEMLPAHELEAAVAEAQRRGLVREAELRRQVARHPRRHGVPSLRALLDRGDGPAFTRSEAERRLLTLVRAGGLPAPETNVRIGRYEVDFVWRDSALIVEVDGYRFHSGRDAFERDRRRDAELQALGYRVMRVTWRQLVDEPEAVLVRLAQALVTR
jgi:very-short-patch-repair endonuclease